MDPCVLINICKDEDINLLKNYANQRMGPRLQNQNAPQVNQNDSNHSWSRVNTVCTSIGHFHSVIL